jgi:hypothetical protein
MSPMPDFVLEFRQKSIHQLCWDNFEVTIRVPQLGIAQKNGRQKRPF